MYIFSITNTTRTYELPAGVRSCKWSAEPHNRATLQLNGILDAGRMYGFELHGFAPWAYHAGQKLNWKIFTADAYGYLIDGTENHVPNRKTTNNFVRAASGGKYTDGFSVYKDDVNVNTRPDALRIFIADEDMRPFSMTGKNAKLTVILKDLPSTINNAKLRITAPFTFEFKPLSYYTGSVADLDVNGTFGEGVDTDWPTGGVVPTATVAANVLEFVAGTYALFVGFFSY